MITQVVTDSNTTDGGLITITGKNFGTEKDLVTVFVWGICESLEITVPHTEITCIVPFGGYGKVPIIIEVDLLFSENIYGFYYDFGAVTSTSTASTASTSSSIASTSDSTMSSSTSSSTSSGKLTTGNSGGGETYVSNARKNIINYIVVFLISLLL